MKETIIRYLEGRATEEESAELLAWLRNGKNSEYFHRCRFDWEKGLDRDWFPEEGRKNWETIQAILSERTYSGWQKTRKMEQFLKYAAIFMGIITLSSLFWLFLVPGRQVKETFSTIMAEKGQLSKVQLPDGSLVWLNSGSSLVYSNFYGDNIRKVNLSGEAFFEVTKNHVIPFRVECGNLAVQVLGTSFNVSENKNSGKIDVVLEKGSVELTGNTGGCRLKPGEMANYDSSDGKFTVNRVNTAHYTSWKEGILNIYDLSLEEVVRKLETRYNQKFEVDREAKNLRYTFTIKNESLADILSLMEMITPVKAVQKENKIVLQIDKKRKKAAG
jgi:transmembrane sensor